MLKNGCGTSRPCDINVNNVTSKRQLCVPRAQSTNVSVSAVVSARRERVSDRDGPARESLTLSKSDESEESEECTRLRLLPLA